MDYYYFLPSPPCRGPLLTAKAVGVKLNLKTLNIFEKEQLEPWFIAINPEHSVPTLVDGDLKLWESRAISGYLANQYGKDDSLYPTEAKARALVDRMLYFDMGTLFQRWLTYINPVFRGNEKPSAEKLEKVDEALGMLDGYLSKSDYAAGSKVTIADHSLLATVTSLEAAGVSMEKHRNVRAWLSRCESLPGYEENAEGAKKFGSIMKPKLGL